MRANIIRNLLDSSIEISVYFHSKEKILKRRWIGDHTGLHILCGVVLFFNQS